MIIERIKRHNLINGFLFSLIEFGIVAALMLIAGAGFAILRRPLEAVVCLGIALNCLPVVYLSYRSLKLKEKDYGIMQLFNTKTREEIAKRYPQTSVDTLVIVTAVLVPFLAVVLTVIDDMRK